ncbi:MAG: alpha/beta hydrolase [Elusimicrobia bacterium]|nr:alpha/beta hydrolase [Elusimicrobiota bacterium]
MNASIFVEGAAGNRLHLVDWGGSGLGLLLLHGMAANTAWWDPVAPLLGGRRVVALDLRGHGDSGWTDGYSLDDYAADVEAVRRGLGWERFSIAAHSLGARIALRCASNGAPLDAAALLDFYAADWPGRAVPSGTRSQPAYADEDSIVARFRLQPPGTLLDEAGLRALARRGVRQGPDGRWSWKFDWRVVSQAVDWDPGEPSRAAIPVLLVRGEASETMPRAAFKSVLNALPDARGVEIPRAHHHVTLDAPRECAEALGSFLDSIPSRS